MTPRAGRTEVRWDGERLRVRVSEPAVDGRANEAALRAIAAALEVPASALAIVRGARSREKVIDLPESGAARLSELPRR